MKGNQKGDVLKCLKKKVSHFGWRVVVKFDVITSVIVVGSK